MKNTLTFQDAEGIFKLKMNDLITSSVSVYTLYNSDTEDELNCDFAELFGSSEVIHNSFTKTAYGEQINIKSIMSPYDSKYEWDIERVFALSEIMTALCDLYPDAYVGNIRNQESIIANFVALTRGLSTYLPEGAMDQFQDSVHEELENEGKLLDAEEEITIYGTIFTKFTSETAEYNDVTEHIHTVVFSVFLEFEDIQFIVNFNFNNGLDVIYNENVAITRTTTAPTAQMGKHVGKDYMTALLRAKLEGEIQLEEEAVTYITAINKEDYAPYNFIYMMNNLFVSAIEGNSSVYRSLKPMNYFVVSDTVVSLDGDIITADNHAILEFIQENQIDIDISIVDEIEDFGDGLLRVLVLFDKIERFDNTNDLLDKNIADYTSLILDKYMGITLTGTTFYTLREYVDLHFDSICKLVGNPNNIENRTWLEIEEPPLVTMPHMIVRDIDEIPLWVYMVAIPCILYLSNTLEDEEIIELAEYDDKGIENHAKFMETVYIVKELLDRKWN